MRKLGRSFVLIWDSLLSREALTYARGPSEHSEKLLEVILVLGKPVR